MHELGRYLVQIVQLASHPNVSVASNVRSLQTSWSENNPGKNFLITKYLAGAEKKLKLRLLEPGATLGYKGSRLEQLSMDVIEGQSLQFHIGRLGEGWYAAQMEWLGNSLREGRWWWCGGDKERSEEEVFSYITVHALI